MDGAISSTGLVANELGRRLELNPGGLFVGSEEDIKLVISLCRGNKPARNSAKVNAEVALARSSTGASLP